MKFNEYDIISCNTLLHNVTTIILWIIKYLAIICTIKKYNDINKFFLFVNYRHYKNTSHVIIFSRCTI